MNTKPSLPYVTSQKGFTLIEVLTVVAVLAIALGGIMFVSNSVDSTREVKFQRDVHALNQAVKVYISNGGKIAEGWDEHEVLGALKCQASTQSKRGVVGLSSNMVDLRMGFDMDESGLGRKAVWDNDSQRFVVATTDKPGIARILLDDKFAPDTIQTEDRTNSVQYASTSSWVWDYQDRSSTPPPPTSVPSRSSTSVPGSNALSPAAPAALVEPEFSHPGGSYPYEDFDLPVVISAAGNTPGSFEILYSIGDGSFSIYEGGPIEVGRGDAITAYAISLNPDLYSDSSTSHAAFSSDPVTLDPAVLSYDYAYIDQSAHPVVTVTLQNPNPSDIPSVVRYRIDGGSWQDYSAPVAFDLSNAPAGAEIEAAVFGLETWVNESEVRSHEVLVKLQPPSLVVSNPDGVDATVVLNNPNPAGSSSMHYRFGALPDASMGAENNYGGAFDFSGEAYPEGVRVIARSIATSSRFIDSDEAAVDIDLADPDDWTIDGTADGLFVDAAGGPSMDVIFTDDDRTFLWGEPGELPWLRSGVSIEGMAFEGVKAGEVFKVGRISYYNGTIVSGTGANAVLMKVGLDIGAGRTASFEVPLELVNVPNNTGTDEGDADFLRINYDAVSPEVQIYGKPYKALLAFGNSSESGFTSVSEFHVFEDASASADVYAVIARPEEEEALLNTLGGLDEL